MYRKLCESLKSDLLFAPPASATSLKQLSDELHCSFPSQLQSFLTEMNGLTIDYGTQIIWSAEDILKTNLHFRSNPDFQQLYMSFDSLLFVGERGNGDQFAYPIQKDGKISKSDILVWEHENDSRTWFAKDLMDYINKMFMEVGNGE